MPKLHDVVALPNVQSHRAVYQCTGHFERASLPGTTYVRPPPPVSVAASSFLGAFTGFMLYALMRLIRHASISQRVFVLLVPCSVGWDKPITDGDASTKSKLIGLLYAVRMVAQSTVKILKPSSLSNIAYNSIFCALLIFICSSAHCRQYRPDIYRVVIRLNTGKTLYAP